MGFRILSHTADLRMQVEGSDREELFRSALQGLMSVLKERVPEVASEKIVRRKIQIVSSDESSLLVDFLNEVLLRSYEHEEIYFRINFQKLSATEAVAEISGTRVAGFDEDVKAATYHEVEIKRTPAGRLETILVFDI